MEGGQEYRFGPFTLDARKRRLWRDGQPVAMTPKAVETLLVLVRHAGRVVDKDDLLRSVWPDTFVSDETLSQNIATIRRALGDSAEDPDYIATWPRRGYQFIARLSSAAEGAVPSATSEIASPTAALASSRSTRGIRRTWIVPLAVVGVLLAAGVGVTTYLQRHAPPLSRDRLSGGAFERSLRVPLVIAGVPQEMVLVGAAPEALDVHLRGPSDSVSRLEPREVSVVLDLTGLRSGLRRFHLSPDNVRAPAGIGVTQVTPSTLDLDFERLAKRLVTVAASTTGEPAPGFVRGKTTVVPPTVEISGPDSRVEQVLQAQAGPVSIMNARATFRVAARVRVPDASVRVTQPQTVQVVVEIMPAPPRGR